MLCRATQYFEMKTAEQKSANVFSSLFNLKANMGMGGGFNAPLKTPIAGQAPNSQTNGAINQVLSRMGNPAAPAVAPAAPAAPKPVPMRPAGVPMDNPVARRRMELAGQAS